MGCRDFDQGPRQHDPGLYLLEATFLDEGFLVSEVKHRGSQKSGCKDLRE